jgi:N-acetylmuramoyl-L-alanine amidase
MGGQNTTSEGPEEATQIGGSLQASNTGGEMLVAHDPGHGGKDPGTSHNGIVEKDWVLQFSQEVVAALPWCQHVLTRTEDRNLGLTEAAQIALDKWADVAICHHVDASSDPDVDGLRCYYLPGDHVGKEMAEAIMRAAPKELLSKKPRPTPCNSEDWTRRAYNCMAPFRAREIPVVLVEWGFVTSLHDSEILKAQRSLPALCMAAGAGIARAYEILHG